MEDGNGQKETLHYCVANVENEDTARISESEMPPIFDLLPNWFFFSSFFRYLVKFISDAKDWTDEELLESISSLVFILKKGKKHAQPKYALDINRAHFGIYLKLSSKLSKGQQRTSSDHSLAVKTG